MTDPKSSCDSRGSCKLVPAQFAGASLRRELSHVDMDMVTVMVMVMVMVMVTAPPTP